MASKPSFKIAGWSVSPLLKQLNVISVKTASDATPKNMSSHFRVTSFFMTLPWAHTLIITDLNRSVGRSSLRSDKDDKPKGLQICSDS